MIQPNNPLTRIQRMLSGGTIPTSPSTVSVALAPFFPLAELGIARYCLDIVNFWIFFLDRTTQKLADLVTICALPSRKKTCRGDPSMYLLVRPPLSILTTQHRWQRAQNHSLPLFFFVKFGI